MKDKPKIPNTTQNGYTIEILEVYLDMEANISNATKITQKYQEKPPKKGVYP